MSVTFLPAENSLAFVFKGAWKTNTPINIICLKWKSKTVVRPVVALEYLIRQFWIYCSLLYCTEEDSLLLYSDESLCESVYAILYNANIRHFGVAISFIAFSFTKFSWKRLNQFHNSIANRRLSKRPLTNCERENRQAILWLLFNLYQVCFCHGSPDYPNYNFYFASDIFNSHVPYVQWLFTSSSFPDNSYCIINPYS